MVVYSGVCSMYMHDAGWLDSCYCDRCRLHGIQEFLLSVLTLPSPSIPLMHQQLAATTTLSGPEMLATFNGSWNTLP